MTDTTATQRLARFAALNEPLPRRMDIPRLSLDDPEFTEKFHLAKLIDDAIQQACELLRAEIAGDLRTVLDEHREMRKQLDAMDTEWSAGHPYDDGRPGLCMHGDQGEYNARRMAERGDGWQAMRRLVGDWQPADREQRAVSDTTDKTGD